MYTTRRIIFVLLISILLTFDAFILLLLRTDSSITQAIAMVFFGIATLVATFQNEIRFLLAKPDFEITCGRESPYVVGNHYSLFHRVRAINKGRTIGRKCYARLNKVISVSDRKVVISDPLNLKWANAPLEGGIHKEIVEVYAKGGEDFFDLLEVIPASINRWSLKIPGSRGHRDLFFQDQGYIFLITFFCHNFDPINLKIWVHMDTNNGEIWAEKR